MTTRAITVATTGSAGSATGTATIGIGPCRLHAVQLDYHASAPATTDVTITNAGRTVATRSNSATDVIQLPREQVVDTSGSPVTGAYDKPYLNGVVTVAVAQSDALAPAVTVTLVLEVA